ncbi:MAG: hypothetical protein LBS40_05815 [Burkholderiales bacterium]|nr:hypothetical protein [Burkholderiales bacterium]
MKNNDIIEEMHRYILELVGNGVPIIDACQRAEEAVRKIYGGDMPYIKKKARIDKAKIISEYRRGERQELLARRYGVSVRWIKEVVRGH